MTDQRHVAGVGGGRAAASHVLDLARHVYVRRPMSSPWPRDHAFHAYQQDVRRIVRGPLSRLRLVDRRLVASGARSRIAELTFATDTRVSPGDVVWLWWRNAADRVADRAPGDAMARYWSTPTPHSPARRRHRPLADVLADVVDLSADSPDVSLSTAPRITPKLYTTSDAWMDDDGWRLRIQVTAHDDWPQRASAFLHRLERGASVDGWVLPHPHRLTTVTRPGLAVATGSGAAAVFAALRAGVRDVRLVWGIGDKQIEPWADDELRGLLDKGTLRIVRSPERVTSEVAQWASEIRELITRGGWVFVSGNAEMAADVDALIHGMLGAEQYEHAERELRYIVSA